MKKLNWSYALGELLLIFLGITLAIAFQNWNEQRKQVQLEEVVLKQLKVALQNDIRDVNANIATHTRGKNSCQTVLQSFAASEDIDANVFLQEIVQAIDYTFLISDVSTYEYLKSVGLHIVRNDSLRRQITNLYDVVYESIYGIENNTRPIQKDVLNSLKNYFTADANFFVPIGDINQIKKDNSIRFDLKNLEFSHQIMISRYKDQIKPQLEILIKMVDQELQ